ncbi:MAG: hypothetical protein GY804_13980, partial [Alphaproteobacteria bacterium]|nr:hypothetical protein [Alphaproteobacteria bacterium]
EGNDEDNEPEINEKEKESIEKESTKKDNKAQDEVEGHESEEIDGEEEIKEDGNNGKKTTKTKKLRKKKVKNACTECGKEVKKGGSMRCTGCFLNCHYSCAGYKDGDDYIKRKDQFPEYKCKECKLETNEKRKRGRPPARRNSMPDIVIHKRKRIVEEGLPIKVSPLKKKNKIGDANPEVTDGEDWKSEKTQIKNQIQQALEQNRYLHDVLNTYIHASNGQTYVTREKTETVTNKTEKNQGIIKSPLIQINGETLYEEDVNSLKEGQWVTGGIIDSYTAEILKDNEDIIKDNKIVFVNTSAMMILNNTTDKTGIKQIINNLKITESNWVIYVINNGKMRETWKEGDHWSLLIYSKEQHQYHHFDSIRGNPNAESAKDLIMNMLDKDSFVEGNLPSYRETDCGKQDNGYDCGIFTISYIAKAIEHIGNKNKWKNMTTTQEEADVLRKLMLSQIKLEIIRHNNFNGTKRKNVEKVKNDNEITEKRMQRKWKWKN